MFRLTVVLKIILLTSRLKVLQRWCFHNDGTNINLHLYHFRLIKFFGMWCCECKMWFVQFIQSGRKSVGRKFNVQGPDQNQLNICNPAKDPRRKFRFFLVQTPKRLRCDMCPWSACLNSQSRNQMQVLLKFVWKCSFSEETHDWESCWRCYCKLQTLPQSPLLREIRESIWINIEQQ